MFILYLCIAKLTVFGIKKSVVRLYTLLHVILDLKYLNFRGKIFLGPGARAVKMPLLRNPAKKFRFLMLSILILL